MSLADRGDSVYADVGKSVGPREEVALATEGDSVDEAGEGAAVDGVSDGEITGEEDSGVSEGNRLGLEGAAVGDLEGVLDMRGWWVCGLPDFVG